MIAQNACEPTKGRLLALLDQDLTAAEARAVRDHLATCEDCRGRLADIEVARAALLAVAGAHLAPNSQPENGCERRVALTPLATGALRLAPVDEELPLAEYDGFLEYVDSDGATVHASFVNELDPSFQLHPPGWSLAAGSAAKLQRTEGAIELAHFGVRCEIVEVASGVFELTCTCPMNVVALVLKRRNQPEALT